MIERILAYALILLITSACATVARLPSSSHQIPETSGRLWGGNVGLNLARSIPITVINDPTTTPPTRNRIVVGEDRNFATSLFMIDSFAGSAYDFSLGLTERLDIYLNRTFGLRAMVLGKPGENGWRMTLFAGPLSEDLANSTSTDSQTRIKSTGIEGGLSVGYRSSEMFLTYLTLTSRGSAAEIQINQPGGEFKYDDKFSHYIATLGLQGGRNLYLRAEISANYVAWSGYSETLGEEISDAGTEWGATLGGGYRW